MYETSELSASTYSALHCIILVEAFEEDLTIYIWKKEELF